MFYAANKYFYIYGMLYALFGMLYEKYKRNEKNRQHLL
ncbi:MAG: hypothetical protein ACI8UC_001270, partial [Psychromonas sp.]